MDARSKRAIVPALVLIAASILALAFVYVHPGAQSGIEGKYDFVVGIGTHSNQSSVIRALKDGRYRLFRIPDLHIA